MSSVAAADYLLSEGFEGPGFENSGWTKFGDPDEDFSAIPLQGRQSLNCVGHQQIFRAFSTSNSFNLYLQMRFTRIPSFQGLFFWRDSFVNTVAEMYMNNGSVELIHGHVIHTSASIFTTNVTYDVWIEWTKGAGADGTMRLFVATDGNKPSAPQLEIVDGNGGAISRFELGPEGVGGNVIFDHLLYAENPIGSSPQGNAPPIISQIPQQTIGPDSTTGPLPFTVTDYETPADALLVTASSSNPILVPNDNISLDGSDSNRTVMVTPAPGQQGTAMIELTVSDGQNTASTRFAVVVVSTNSAHTFLLSEGFEGPGFENSGWTKAGTPNEDYDTLPLHGSQSLHTLGGQRIIRDIPSDDSLFFYFKVRFLTFPGFQSLIDWQRSDIDLNVVAQMYMNGGVVTLGHGASHVTGSAVLTTGTTYDIWIDWTKGAGANGTMQLFIATDGIKPSVPDVTIDNGAGGSLGRIAIGPDSRGDVIFDSLLIDNIPIGNAAADNSAPSISDIRNQTLFGNTSSGPIGFRIGDAETPAANLILTASCSNPTLIPEANITFDGSDSNRTITVTPAADQYGSSKISLVVSDGFLTATDTFLVTVTAGVLTLTVDDASRSYGVANPTFSGSINGLQPGDNISLVLDSPAVPESSIGNYPITVAFSDANDKLSHYTVVTNNGSLTVSRGPLAVTVDDTIRLYGSTNPAFTGTIVGLKNLDNITASYTATATATTPVGSYVISAVLADPDARLGNYEVVSRNGNLRIDPALLSVSAADQSRAYGAENRAFTGSILGIQNSDNLTLAFSTVATASSPVGAYAIVPHVNDPETKLGNYSVSSVNGTLTINPALLTGTADAKSRAYGETNPVFTVSYRGFVNNEDASVITGTLVSTTTAETFSPVGSYPITVSGQSASNYTIVYVDGTLTVSLYVLTVKAADNSKVYGQSDPAFTVSYTGFFNGDTVSVLEGTLAFSRQPGEAVGNYTITPSGLTCRNYAITFASGTLTINPALLTGTADDKSRAYGETNPVFGVSYSGFVNNEDASVVTGTLVGSTTAETNSPVGSYPIRVSGQSASNYAIVYVEGTLTVSPSAFIVKARDQQKIYGQSDPPFSVSYRGFANGDTESMLGGALAFSRQPGETVSNYTITPSGLTSSNYAITFITGTLAINKAILSVTAADASRFYGDANPVFMGALRGVQSGDNITASYGTGATPASPVGNYDIVPLLQDSDAKLVNYEVTSNNGTLLITKAPLTVTVDNISRRYGSPNPPLTGTMTGLRNSDNITASYSTDATQASPPGSYSINAIAMDPDGKLGNYALALNTGVLTVRPAGMTGIIIDDNFAHIFGNADPGVTFNIQLSSDLNSWTDLGTITTAPDGSFEVIDTQASTLDLRFYRAVVP